ncbi:hypothetical protein [Cesiribacter andamanensis]|uniref:Uncharacterized protein n=1 Tax=Cesiribacter andamanensis AMV16 TaxID=1279009 RepID=M7N192_9BACT|nr:hypothetical protein [Cesiribacter andamanensis]EMR01067.1 hypothetical protein ADICEAN_03815 [Cesiribacter andamanensis AMV16]
MSSHHIVRDEQEPALLLWQPGQLSFAQAGQLLEWSPRVVVHQQALAEALAWGIKLDAVWAASLEQDTVVQQVAHQQPVAVLPLPAKDPLQGVIAWLRNKKQSSLNLVADAEADTFALLRQLEGMQQEGVQLQLISQGWRYNYIRRPEMRKWLPAGSLLRVLAFGAFPKVEGVMIESHAAGPQRQEIRLQQSGLLSFTGGESFWLGEHL